MNNVSNVEVWGVNVKGEKLAANTSKSLAYHMTNIVISNQTVMSGAISYILLTSPEFNSKLLSCSHPFPIQNLITKGLIVNYLTDARSYINCMLSPGYQNGI